MVYNYKIRYVISFVVILSFLLCGCTSNKVIIGFQQNSDMLRCRVTNGVFTLKHDDQVESDVTNKGHINIREIIKIEKLSPNFVYVIWYHGFYFLTARGFSNVWIIKPKKDGVKASAKPVKLPRQFTEEPMLRIDKNGVKVYLNRNSGLKIFTNGKTEFFYD